MNLSVWGESVSGGSVGRAPLSHDITTDALVIGGGMAGVLTAYRLKQTGMDCVIAEAQTVGSGITKNTTAKITAQHGLLYAQILERLGSEAAKLYLDAHTQAIGDFRELSQRYPCDFEEKNAYVYSISDRAALEREAAAYHKLGLAARLEETPPLPFPTAGALCMEHQAQFNPLKLLTALAREVTVYERTPVRSIDGRTAVTDGGKITAGHIVLATHYPMINIPGLYFLKLYQHRSYVIALEDAPPLDGMYVDERQDGHSFRTYQNLLLIGGGDHKSGKEGGGFAELRGLAQQYCPLAKERFHWATQDCMTLDGLPYIGRHRAGSPQLYVATGFNKWGMTGSMVAARLLRDLMVGGKSELETLFSPRRSMLSGQLFKNIASSAAGLLSVGGPRCAHMGCKLHLNSAEKTWDCPCHGSRFDEDGRVIDNPAKRGIKR